MASWNEPALVNKISDDVPAIKNLLIALLKMTDSGTEDVPADAKRLHTVEQSGNVVGWQIQNYSGTAWSTIGKLMHDVDMLDGKHATSSATADTIPVRDSNGKLAGDILGNANTATTASQLASNYIVPVANGGTGASDEAGARTNLGTNNAANITTGVLAIERGGTGSGTKNFVDLSNDQIIGGKKTFSGNVVLNKSNLQMTVLDTTEGATTERTDILIQGISDNQGYGISSLFGSGSNTILGAGEGKNSLLAELAGNAGEVVYIIADGNIVFHPNAQTYANKKTVTLNTSGDLTGLSTIFVTNSFVKNHTEITKGTNPSAVKYWTLTFCDKDGSNYSNNCIGMLETNMSAAGVVQTYIRAMKNEAASSAASQLGVAYDTANNLAYTFAPTPANNDRSTKIATTAYIGNCVIPVNTRMLFQQTAAPTGWTKETGSGYNNAALRFVTGDVTNYTDGSAFTTIMASGRGTANQTQGGTIANATQGGTIAKTTAGGTNAAATQGGTVGNKALSVAMLAAHTHTMRKITDSSGGGAIDDAGGSGTSNTGSTGSGSNHNHSFTGSSHNHTFTGTAHTHTFTGSAHSHTFTGSAHNHTINMNVKYIDCIIAKKA